MGRKPRRKPTSGVGKRPGEQPERDGAFRALEDVPEDGEAAGLTPGRAVDLVLSVRLDSARLPVGGLEFEPPLDWSILDEELGPIGSFDALQEMAAVDRRLAGLDEDGEGDPP